MLRECLGLFQELGERIGQARSLEMQGLAAHCQGESATGRALLEQALALHREMGEPIWICRVLMNLGRVVREAGHRDAGDYAVSRALLHEAVVALPMWQPRMTMAYRTSVAGVALMPTRVLYFEQYIVVDPGLTPLEESQLLTEEQYYEARDEYGEDAFRAGIGAEAIREMLAAIDLDAEATTLREELAVATGELKPKKIIKRLKLIEAFIESNTRPEWMILSVVPEGRREAYETVKGTVLAGRNHASVMTHSVANEPVAAPDDYPNSARFLKVAAAMTRELDPTLPVFAIRTMDEGLRLTIAQARFNTMLMSLLGATGLVLAASALFAEKDPIFDQQGVRDLVIIHFPEGAFARTRKGEDVWQSALKLPPKYIAGTAGAAASGSR